MSHVFCTGPERKKKKKKKKMIDNLKPAWSMKSVAMQPPSIASGENRDRTGDPREMSSYRPCLSGMSTTTRIGIPGLQPPHPGCSSRPIVCLPGVNNTPLNHDVTLIARFGRDGITPPANSFTDLPVLFPNHDEPQLEKCEWSGCCAGSRVSLPVVSRNPINPVLSRSLAPLTHSLTHSSNTASASASTFP
ncbi:hypothetical protein BO99DRAFT_33432 [Aspergillus violaceofuscus CBS 115571]|uniref:Uncharacterized protein n=1 Tax=Aspergillus violaceofuscus (strain CBS 115571) TaxID=1450538 RepID=A0A2V5HL52_ASPV1|nr:hypothetical protein BO99DRAFT_33432 [Aspergillus violaceofuscus CBS 115571]